MEAGKHRMYVTGDCHGERARMLYSGFAYNRDLKEGDILFCCGDWGYISDNSGQERKYIMHLIFMRSDLMIILKM